MNTYRTLSWLLCNHIGDISLTSSVQIGPSFYAAEMRPKIGQNLTVQGCHVWHTILQYRTRFASEMTFPGSISSSTHICVLLGRRQQPNIAIFTNLIVDKLHSGMNFTPLLACSHIPTP